MCSVRGVAFEFRYQVDSHRRIWDVAFSFGSIMAALRQGLIVGGLIQGVTITANRFSGSVFDVFRPFPLVTAAAVLNGYLVLGSGWLHLKATGALRLFAERMLHRATPLFAGLAAVSCIASVFVQPGIAAAWSAHSAPLTLTIVLFFSTFLAVMAVNGEHSDILPFALALSLFGLGMSGLVLVVYPNIVPFRLPLWDAASSTLSHVFLLIGPRL
jgi:cytochrome d ubiquinol oxidase subunit II